MKNTLYFLIASLLLVSCAKKSEIQKEFNCNASNLSSLETITDVNKFFSVQFPKTWKTQLYYDTTQSSIFTADTTKQLTETVLLDVTFIKKSIIFNTAFKLQQEQESLAKNLIQVKSNQLQMLNKPSYYTLSKGKKGTFIYQVCNTFIKINEESFILVKTEIYGDSLINQRMCKAFNLIEKIKINNK